MIVYNMKLLFLCCLVGKGLCWDTEDFEIFDVVEEVNRNFYEIMGISQDASLPEVKKAYRNLSRQLHPDKNDAPDAAVQFRQMVSVYEILKNEGKRQRYNRVLIEGIPDWKSAVYYYRRARKMSLVEIAVILTIVISITQYLMAWGSYWDKRHTLEDFLLRKLKIKEGKKKKPEDLENLVYIDEQLKTIEKPSWWRILPIQFVQFIIFLFINGPTIVKSVILARKEEKRQREEELLRAKEEKRRLILAEEKRKERKAEHKPRKKVDQFVPDYTGMPSIYTAKPKKILEAVEDIPVIIGGPWTDDDFVYLTKLMNKYPGGTFERWETIAAFMKRTVYEVTKMASKVKSGFGMRSVAPEEIIQPKVKVKTKGKVNDDDVVNAGADELWDVVQQKSLENAIKKYPKGVDQRWEKISHSVTDKSKEDCMLRFKFLAEKIKKKKEEKLHEEQPAEEMAPEKVEKNELKEVEKDEHEEHTCLIDYNEASKTEAV